MFKEIIIFGGIVAVCIAEVPRSGPYAPSGWKPQGAPFTLPKDFLPQQQRQQQQQQQQQPNKVDVEISQERVEYAGQLGEATTTNEPNNGYLPPETDDIPEENTTDDYLKVQGLPSNDPNIFNQQNGQLRNGQLNEREYVPPQASGQYRTQNNRQFGQIQQQQQRQQPQPLFGKIQQQPQQQQQRKQQPQPQFGKIQQQQVQFRQVQQQPQFGQQVGVPTQEYGPPSNENAEPNPSNGDDGNNSDNDNGNNDDGDSEEGPTIAVSNAVSNGQYYVLTPDNTLQRVLFMTTQSEDEVRTNGFTAQLRYMPVEPIRDPIYAYNEEGQLIRIFNKK